MCNGRPVGPSYSFDFTPPEGVSLSRAATLLTAIDEYHARGQGFRDYRQFAVLHSSEKDVRIQCNDADEAHLRQAFSSYLSEHGAKPQQDLTI
ncbi:MAG: hypothetical protein AABX14_05060 [Candidatus Aenigmatarchaeota archaeon]